MKPWFDRGTLKVLAFYTIVLTIAICSGGIDPHDLGHYSERGIAGQYPSDGCCHRYGSPAGLPHQLGFSDCG